MVRGQVGQDLEDAAVDDARVDVLATTAVDRDRLVAQHDATERPVAEQDRAADGVDLRVTVDEAAGPVRAPDAGRARRRAYSVSAVSRSSGIEPSSIARRTTSSTYQLPW